MSFSQPAAGGDSFTPADHQGHLLLIYPKAYNPAEDTSKGLTQAADVDIVIVDKLGPTGQPLVFKDARVFGNLARSVRVLTEADGSPKKYLGRLGQGPNTKGTPPWILLNWTEADVAAATPVAAAFEAGQFSAPANPMAAAPPAPPQQQWQQSPPSGAPASPPAQQQWQQPPVGAPQGYPAPAPQATGAAPQQQWTPPPAAPTPPSAPAASAVDPQLGAFLAQRGVTQPMPDMATAVSVARTFQPDFGQQFPQYQ
ncbi:hypothetical protein [Streptomyces sp. S1]|uniref:hypothetical protein n=1 Tax=Streptomyces sp. S1 TaxID=718288 RepID=UPI003D711874